MLLEEIRRDAVDKNGTKHNKIVCVALAEDDSGDIGRRVLSLLITRLYSSQ